MVIDSPRACISRSMVWKAAAVSRATTYSLGMVPCWAATWRAVYSRVIPRKRSLPKYSCVFMTSCSKCCMMCSFSGSARIDPE